MDASKKRDTALAIELGTFGGGVYQHVRSHKAAMRGYKDSKPYRARATQHYDSAGDAYVKSGADSRVGRIHMQLGDMETTKARAVIATSTKKSRLHSKRAIGLYAVSIGAGFTADHYGNKIAHQAYYTRTMNGKKIRAKNPNYGRSI